MSILDTHKVDFKILDRPDMPVAKFAPGDTIIKKGAPAKEMFLLRKGRVAVKVGDEYPYRFEASAVTAPGERTGAR